MELENKKRPEIVEPSRTAIPKGSVSKPNHHKGILI